MCLDKGSKEYGSITSTPKKEWRGFSVLNEIKKRIKVEDCDIFIDTDVNSCAMAEYLIGNHSCKESLAYITIGTGVGLGLIINKLPVHGLTHPEGGHISVKLLEEDKNFVGSCPFHKQCLEVGPDFSHFVVNNNYSLW